MSKVLSFARPEIDHDALDRELRVEEIDADLVRLHDRFDFTEPPDSELIARLMAERATLIQ